MNWTRGFFRLWLAFAAVCLVIAVLSNSEGIVNPHVKRTLYYDTQDDSLQDSYYMVTLAEDRRVFQGEAVNLFGNIWLGSYTANFSDNISITFVTLTDRNAKTIEYGMWPAKQPLGAYRSSEETQPRLVELQVRVEDTVRQKVAERRLASLGYLLGLGIGLPLGVLAFGAAIAWILKGFRKE